MSDCRTWPAALQTQEVQCCARAKLGCSPNNWLLGRRAGEFRQSVAAEDWSRAHQVFIDQLGPGWFWRKSWERIADAVQQLKPHAAGVDAAAQGPPFSAGAGLYAAYLALKVRPVLVNKARLCQLQHQHVPASTLLGGGLLAGEALCNSPGRDQHHSRQTGGAGRCVHFLAALTMQGITQESVWTVLGDHREIALCRIGTKQGEHHPVVLPCWTGISCSSSSCRQPACMWSVQHQPASCSRYEVAFVVPHPSVMHNLLFSQMTPCASFCQGQCLRAMLLGPF